MRKFSGISGMTGSESQPSFANRPANDAVPLPADGLPSQSHFRQFVESLLCLALAVIVFRAFIVEGYMISTGSMAPALLGFHKQVICPSCKFPFAFGVSYRVNSSHTISGDGEDDLDEETDEPQLCTCPNCGQRGIDISQVPRNQGDQLLVFREAYLWRNPHRWEVIVFRNPYETTQAYVKRLAGLPGETIAIRGGDVYADGTLCRKDYETQKAMRMAVYDHDYEPADDPSWHSRWKPTGGWERDGHGFLLPAEFAPSIEEPAKNAVHGLNLPPDENPWSWVTYRHYLRSGGRHRTSVELPVLDEELHWPPGILPIQFDLKTRKLSVVGVMSDELHHQLKQVSDDPRYRKALKQLYRRSHFAPVTDDYGYNRPSSQSGLNAVRDLMISLQLNVAGPSEASLADRQFAVEMTDGANVYRLVLDYGSGEARLFGNPDRRPYDPPLRAAVQPAGWKDAPCRVEMSLIDRQVTAAINGEEIFPAWPIPASAADSELPRFPVRLGARGLAVRVDALQLFRDVFYTGKGDEKPFTLKDDELYVLGDNSPVSLDSRRWEYAAVPMQLLLGKPFVVHLPSRQMKVRIGSFTRHIRIPDFPRVRYIR